MRRTDASDERQPADAPINWKWAVATVIGLTGAVTAIMSGIGSLVLAGLAVLGATAFFGYGFWYEIRHKERGIGPIRRVIYLCSLGLITLSLLSFPILWFLGLIGALGTDEIASNLGGYELNTSRNVGNVAALFIAVGGATALLTMPKDTPIGGK